MAPDEVVGEAQLFTELTDFVFVEILEGFNDQALLDEGVDFGNAVVVGLDLVGVLGGARFDGVGVDGALAEHPFLRIEVQLMDGFALDFDEELADDGPLFFGIGDAFDSVVKVLLGVVDVQVVVVQFVEGGLDFFDFSLAHKAGVDEPTADLVFS